MGQGSAGRETQGLNILQLGHGMQLKNFACVCVRPRACIWTQKIKHPDASRRGKANAPLCGICLCRWLRHGIQFSCNHDDYRSGHNCEK